MIREKTQHNPCLKLTTHETAWKVPVLTRRRMDRKLALIAWLLDVIGKALRVAARRTRELDEEEAEPNPRRRVSPRDGVQLRANYLTINQLTRHLAEVGTQCFTCGEPAAHYCVYNDADAILQPHCEDHQSTTCRRHCGRMVIGDGNTGSYWSPYEELGHLDTRGRIPPAQEEEAIEELDNLRF